MVNTIKRVVDQYGNHVRLCCNNHHLYFSEDNNFLRLNEFEDHGYNVDGIIYYQLASRLTGKRK